MTLKCNSQVSVGLEQVIGEEISLYEGFMGDLQELPFQRGGMELIKVQSEAPLGEGGALSGFSLSFPLSLFTGRIILDLG